MENTGFLIVGVFIMRTGDTAINTTCSLLSSCYTAKIATYV
jgi:hypothetical protein